MAVRSSMSQLIAELRLMIADPNPNPGVTVTQFLDQDIQDRLDAKRTDVRYENLDLAPTIVNASSTSNIAQFVYADFYSKYQWWEQDVVLQGYQSNNFWIVLTPLASDYITGHWQFELTPFVNGTVPGQLPPVYATGKVYDLNYAAADLLGFWAATLAGAYDVTVDGQTMHRSQLMQQKFALSAYYRKLSKPIVAKMRRTDLSSTISTRSSNLLGSGYIGDGFKGV